MSSDVDRNRDSQPSHSSAEPPGDTQSTNPNQQIGDGHEIAEDVAADREDRP